MVDTDTLQIRTTRDRNDDDSTVRSTSYELMESPLASPPTSDET